MTDITADDAIHHLISLGFSEDTARQIVDIECLSRAEHLAWIKESSEEDIRDWWTA